MSAKAKIFGKSFFSILAGIFIVVCSGCIEENFDSTALEKRMDFELGLASPVGYRSFTMNDFFHADSQRTFLADENGLLYLHYLTSFESPSFGEIFSVPDITLSDQLMNESGGDVDLSDVEIQYEFSDTIWIQPEISPEMDDMVLTRIDFNNILFAVTTSSSFGLNVSHQIELPTLTSNNIAFKLAVQANGNYSETLSDYSLQLQEHDGVAGLFPVIIHSVFYPSNTVIPEGNEVISYTLSLEELDFEIVYGNFSGYSIDLPATSINLDIYESIPHGTFHFSRPEVTVVSENSAGVPVGFILTNFGTFTRETGWQPFQGSGLPDAQSPWVYNFPTTSENNIPAFDSLQITHDQWSFPEESGDKPEEIVLESTLQLNPSKDPGEQFIHKESQTMFDFNLKLPLYGYAQFLAMTDTMSFLISDFVSDDYEKIQKAFFRFYVTNGFPVSFNLQVYMANSNYSVIDSLFMERQLISPATQVDEITEPHVNEPIIAEIDQRKFDVMNQQVVYLISNVHLQTAGFTEESPTDVGIYSNQFLEINLGLVLDLEGSISN